MKYGINFTKGFITQVDELLGEVYNEHLRREDFFHLFYIIDRARRFLRDSGAAELPRDTRKSFGRYNHHGTIKWRFIELIRACKDMNILFTTTYSTDKHKCKAYGYTVEFATEFKNKELELQMCEVSEKTYNSMLKFWEPPSDPVLMKHYSTLQKIDIDMDSTETFIRGMNSTRFFRTIRDVITIHDKEHFIVTLDERTGRIFTTFNLIKRELRDMCTIDGKRLISVDLKSSQPYFLASILLKENPNNEQVQRFYNLITQHDIYDWFEDQLGGFSETHSRQESRQFIKEWFFGYLYKSNSGTNVVQDIMMKEFNEVYELIKLRKRQEELWLTLQKVEADIFIPTCNRLVERGCLSVHDALYFTEDIQEDVVGLLDSRFQSQGFRGFRLVSET